MKKIQILALIALFLALGCSKDDMANTVQDSAVFEESNLSFANGERKSNPNNGVSSIWFDGIPNDNGNFRENCLPDGLKLLNQGYFSGKITGYGRINPSLSTYEFISCKEMPSDLPPQNGEPLMYVVEALGTLALGPRDYCNITITGNIYPYYSDEVGYYSGTFDGIAITSSGVGKLKVFDNKTFYVYNGRHGRINLEIGTLTLFIKDRP